jgi:hypothetical protein
MDVGSFSVEVYVSDGVSSNPYIIAITVTNTAPVFQTAPSASLSVVVGKKLAYSFPTIIDAEGHTPAISILPNGLTWVTVSLTTLTITPTITESGLS